MNKAGTLSSASPALRQATTAQIAEAINTWQARQGHATTHGMRDVAAHCKRNVAGLKPELARR